MFFPSPKFVAIVAQAGEQMTAKGQCRLDLYYVHIWTSRWILMRCSKKDIHYFKLAKMNTIREMNKRLEKLESGLYK